ncbi:MAG: nitrilase-related carbon-nitrogen hydrolase [Trueperaceae bacterium]
MSATLHAPSVPRRAHTVPSNTTRFAWWVPAMLSAGMVAVAVRPWGFGWLAWVALAPAFAALLRARTLREGAVVAAVAALGLIAVAYEAVAGIGIWAYPPVTLLGTLPFAAAGAATVAFRRSTGVRAATIALPLLWCAAEWLPAQPWLAGRWALTLSVIGYSQADLPAMQLARFSSVTATSLAVLVGNALLVHSLSYRSGRAVLGIVALSALVAAAWWTRADARTGPSRGGESVTLRLVQPFLTDAERAAATVLPGVRAALLARLREASLRSAGQAGTDGAGGADAEPILTVWPEASWPGRVRHDGYVASVSAGDAAWLDGLAPLLLGASARDGVRAANSGTPRASNAAFLWTGDALQHVFDKRHLVPIVEDGLTAGPEATVTEVLGVFVAPAICYDVVLPSFARSAARAGADLLAVLVDDGFAARGDVPIQHLRVAAFRAVETALPLAFASNTGPSGVVDGAGRVLARTGSGSQDVLVATLGIGASPTPYVRYGDWVGALVCLTLVGWTALAGARGGASRRPPPL